MRHVFRPIQVAPAGTMDVFADKFFQPGHTLLQLTGLAMRPPNVVVLLSVMATVAVHTLIGPLLALLLNFGTAALLSNSAHARLLC